MNARLASLTGIDSLDRTQHSAAAHGVPTDCRRRQRPSACRTPRGIRSLQGEARLAGSGANALVVKAHVVGRAAQLPRQPEPRLVVERRRESERDAGYRAARRSTSAAPAERFAFVGGQVHRMPSLGERDDHRLEVAEVREVHRAEQDSSCRPARARAMSSSASSRSKRIVDVERLLARHHEAARVRPYRDRASVTHRRANGQRRPDRCARTAAACPGAASAPAPSRARRRSRSPSSRISDDGRELVRHGHDGDDRIGP